MSLSASAKTDETSLFATTRWSVVRAASEFSNEERMQALSGLFQSYWRPLYTFMRGVGRTKEEAEDVVQEFFVRLLDGRLLRAATPERGRFRTVMLTSLRNLDEDFRRSERTQKRGGDVQKVSLDFADGEATWLQVADASLTPEAAFDRVWARSLVELSRSRLRAECEAEGRGAMFAELFPFITSGELAGDFGAAAARLDMNEKAARVALSRLRRRYTAAIREEIAQTVGSQEEERDELRYLLENFS